MELNILDWFQTLHTPILDKIMTLITKLGDAGIFWIILTLLFLIIPKMRKTGIIMAAALIMDLLICNVAVKNLAARTRPYDRDCISLSSTLKDSGMPAGGRRRRHLGLQREATDRLPAQQHRIRVSVLQSGGPPLYSPVIANSTHSAILLA